MPNPPKTHTPIAEAPAMGPVILANLLRLGFAEVKPQAARIAKLAGSKGRPITRQRISQIVNAVRVEPETVETIAQAVGVKPAELLRR